MYPYDNNQRIANIKKWFYYFLLQCFTRKERNMESKNKEEMNSEIEGERI
jgi:hypothetical protein